MIIRLRHANSTGAKCRICGCEFRRGEINVCAGYPQPMHPRCGLAYLDRRIARLRDARQRLLTLLPELRGPARRTGRQLAEAGASHA
jgi:hypothetical protein